MSDEEFKAILESIKLEAKQCAELRLLCADLRLRAEALLEAVRQWSVTTSNKEEAA